MYGYARVSSRDQNLNRQLDALGAYGVGSANIYADHASGKDFGRPRKPCPPQFELVRDSYEAGDITRSQAAKCLGVCVGTFDRWMREAG